jgi:hypothetical protein
VVTIMRFVLKFKTGADVEFEIPEEDLQRAPETMLSVMSRPRWTGSEGAPEVQRLEAPETAKDAWSDGMDAFVVAWYASTDNQGRDARFELPAGVELVDAVAIADWLLLELDFEKITYTASNDAGALSRVVRAKAYIERRKDRAKTMVALTEAMRKKPRDEYHFGFLADEDDASYVNKCLDKPFLKFAGNYGTWERLGTVASAFEWAQDEGMREATVRDLKDYGFDAKWLHKYLELSGPRGVEVLGVRQDVVPFRGGHVHEALDGVPDALPGLGRDDAPAVGADVSGWRSWGVTLVKLLDA